MALEQKLNLRLSQRLVMTPSLQQAIKLLQMSRLELQEVLTQEMVENPILEDQEEEAQEPAERTESTQEPEEAPASVDATAPAEKDRDSFDEIDFDSYFSDYLDSAYNPRQYQEEPEEYSLENVLTRPEGLPEHLNWQLSMSEASPAVREIAAFLIGNLDEDGYLRVSREEVNQAYPNDVDVETAMKRLVEFLDYLLPQYDRESKSYLSIGVGCTGGKHRSVYVAEQLARLLKERGYPVRVSHRDATRE